MKGKHGADRGSGGGLREINWMDGGVVLVGEWRE
jgi:hypothetical protein